MKDENSHTDLCGSRVNPTSALTDRAFFNLLILFDLHFFAGLLQILPKKCKSNRINTLSKSLVTKCGSRVKLITISLYAITANLQYCGAVAVATGAPLAPPADQLRQSREIDRNVGSIRMK